MSIFCENIIKMMHNNMYARFNKIVLFTEIYKYFVFQKLLTVPMNSKPQKQLYRFVRKNIKNTMRTVTLICCTFS